MSFVKELDKLSTISGFKSYKHFLYMFFLPSIVGILILAIVLSQIPYVPMLVLLPTVLSLLAIIVVYPFIEYNKQKKSIHDNLHYFITYAGTISTMDVTRNVLFKRISEKAVFGEISIIFGKIYYLAKKWNLGYASACRKVAYQVPSPIFADFLDRLAVVMDFGQDLSSFLVQEQSEILNDYAIEYKKSINSIDLFKEIFVAVTVSTAFLVGLGLLAPLLLDIAVENIVLFAVLGVLFVDVIMIVITFSVIPKDKLIIRGKHQNKELKKLQKTFLISIIITGLFFLLLLGRLELMLVLALASFPLIIPGLMASGIEKKIIKKDSQFPVFTRIVGASIDVGNRGVISALRSTQVHDFDALNDMAHHLYRRLRVGAEKFESWNYFAEESGSDLINNFTRIYIESIYLGGNAQKIGEIVSNNTSRLNSLRKLRVQASKSLRGTLYGALIGIVGTIYISAQISETLVEVFSSVPEIEGSVVNVAGSILPTISTIDFSVVYMYIALLVLIHSVSSAVIMKLIDGGSIYGCLIDIVNMLVIGSLLALLLPPLADMMLPEIQPIG